MKHKIQILRSLYQNLKNFILNANFKKHILDISIYILFKEVFMISWIYKDYIEEKICVKNNNSEIKIGYWRKAKEKNISSADLLMCQSVNVV